MKPMMIATVALGLAGPLTAQVTTKKVLTLDGAKMVAGAAVAEAKRLNTTGVIAVVDDGGNLMYLERIDNTFAAGAAISTGKARTAVLFKHPTRVFEDIIKGGRTPMIALNDFTPLQGGVPVEVDGQIVGGIGVSGAASAQQDEDLAIAGSKAFMTMTSGGSYGGRASPPVSYWNKKQVDDAFATGAVLFDGKDGRNYMVHASRREKAGMAEVHELDADVIHVLSGTAEIITGGTVVDGKTIGASEIRGSGIEGGEAHTLAKGDVMIVPKGTPHWFKQVDAPFTYYVVKVR